METRSVLANPGYGLPEPQALAAAIRSTLTQGCCAERPSLLLVGDGPEVARLADVLDEHVALTTVPVSRLPPIGTWDLILCFDLPPAVEDASELAERLASATDRLLFAPLHWLADPIRYGETLHKWLGLLAEAGLIYDTDGAAALPQLLIQMKVFYLRRAQISSTAALGFLTLALYDQAQMLAVHRTLAADQDRGLSLLTRLSLDLRIQLSTASNQHRRLGQALGEVSSDWSQLQSSPGFALLKQIQLARARLAPPGTRRERLLEMILGWLRILSRRGLPGLADHVRGEVFWRAKAITARFDRHRHYRIETIEIPPIRRRLTIRAHQASVEIVICVHNALADVQRCLDSVVRHTNQPYALILVDDGSASATHDYLIDFARRHPRTTLLRNESACGYTVAANQGLRQSSAAFVVLLNSDTVVTHDWLDRMIACAEVDGRTGLVGPLSNTASWQSVPEIALGADWAENPLPSTMDLDTWATQIAERSARLYPSMPLLNGFCLLIRRAVIDDIGLFDEAAFGAGYGEENDYCLRARAAGWQLALADDTYIFHAQSRSYSHERRKQLSDHAAQALAAKHGEAVIDQSVAHCRESYVLAGIRARAAVLAERAQVLDQGRRYFGGRRLLFLLPADSPGGGANVVIAESRAMQQMGVEVAFFNQSRSRTDFEASYPGLDIPVHFGEPNDVSALAAGYDAIIATWHTTVYWMKGIDSQHHVLGYYAQDYEPYFFEEGSADWQRAVESYTTTPGLCLFTKTEWNRQELLEQSGASSVVVGPSVEIDRYRPRPMNGADSSRRPIHVVAMVRPNSARRSPRLTMHLLRRLSHRYGDRVKITVFGVKPNDPGLAALPQDFHWRLAGVITPDQVATLLAQSDIFTDFSTYQAMGLTALEAMASGAAVIVPEQGGTHSFARADENALIVDTTSESACWSALVRLVEDEDLRRQLRRQAISDVCHFYPEQTAYQILSTLFHSPGEAT